MQSPLSITTVKGSSVRAAFQIWSCVCSPVNTSRRSQLPANEAFGTMAIKLSDTANLIVKWTGPSMPEAAMTSLSTSGQNLLGTTIDKFFRCALGTWHAWKLAQHRQRAHRLAESDMISGVYMKPSILGPLQSEPKCLRCSLALHAYGDLIHITT